MKLDVEAEGFSKELEEIRAGQIKTETKVEEKKAKPIFLEAPFSAEAAKSAQMELAKSLGKPMEAKIDLSRGVKLEMVLIPAGKFVMGSPLEEKGRKENENQHKVIISKEFYMGKYEVTQEQWQVIMGNNPSETKGARLPVTNVSWNDSQAFIKRLNANGKGGYRLPTEAEWEYACRAGTTTAYSFGDTITPNDENIKSSGFNKPISVGSCKPNAFGLYDMHGNVCEWCEDWYGDFPKGLSIPKGSTIKNCCMVRGGAFDGYGARSAFRFIEARHYPNRIFGFRLAKTP